jgi:hypothetical protein
MYGIFTLYIKIINTIIKLAGKQSEYDSLSKAINMDIHSQIKFRDGDNSLQPKRR